MCEYNNTILLSIYITKLQMYACSFELLQIENLFYYFLHSTIFPSELISIINLFTLAIISMVPGENACLKFIKR